jgi:Tfp pilus assembly protein PilZ
MGRRSNEQQSARKANTRASDRVHIGVPAALKWSDKQLTGVVELVNLGGMYVATTKCPELGDYVDFLFSLPGDRRSFRVRGSVVFIDPAPEGAQQPPGFGARFERPPVALLEAIKALQKKDH